MGRIATVLTLLLGLAGPAAADPLESFFEYREPRLPRGGDCASLAAALGSAAVWYGAFSGKRFDKFTDNYYPFAARGCFPNETACRIWQQRALTYAGAGPLYYTSCRQGRG